MPQVIQAKCPRCANVLRIPSDWLAQPIRCKFCKQTFQMRAKSTPTVAMAHAATADLAPPAAPPPPQMKPKSTDPFGFDDDGEPAPATPRKPRKKGYGVFIALGIFFILFVGAATGAGIVVYKAFNPNRDSQAKNGGTEDGPASNQSKSFDNNGQPINDGKGKKNAGVEKKTGAIRAAYANDIFPRRALLINVNEYLLFTPVLFGAKQGEFAPAYPGSSISVVRDKLPNAPMKFAPSQVFLLSDGVAHDEGRDKKLRDLGKKDDAPRPHSTQKSVLEAAIKDFVDTCREQDRVLILFAGHGAYIEDPEPEDAKKDDKKDEAKKPTGKAYLLPVEGDLKKPGTLLPLDWVFAELAKCKAQQKILVLDVFRFSPSRGFEGGKTGEGEEGTMPEDFDKALLTPPPGVQVWSSCIKEQSSIELDGGSAFLQALCQSLQPTAQMKGFVTPDEPIPIDDLVNRVNQRLKELLTPEKRKQTSRLTGKAGDKHVPYNREEPLAAAITLKPPTAGGAKAAGLASIDAILREISQLPPARETRGGSVITAANLPAFPAQTIDAYKTEKGQDMKTMHDLYKDKKTQEQFAKDYPLRNAYFEIVDALQQSNKLRPREVLASPVDPKRKAAFLMEQDPLGRSIFSLESLLNSTVKEADEMRNKETSKRWLADYDFAKSRLQARIMYLYEYNFTLGQIRADNLPELAPGQSGWRVGVKGEKLSVGEKKAKDLFNSTKKLRNFIQETYADTPWALMAQRESMIRLGLEWRPKSD